MKNQNYRLYNNIRTYRLRRKLTQSELARACGVFVNTISSIELHKQEPTAKFAAAISFVLCISFEDLFRLI